MHVITWNMHVTCTRFCIGNVPIEESVFRWSMRGFRKVDIVGLERPNHKLASSRFFLNLIMYVVEWVYIQQFVFFLFFFCCCCFGRGEGGYYMYTHTYIHTKLLEAIHLLPTRLARDPLMTIRTNSLRPCWGWKWRCTADSQICGVSCIRFHPMNPWELQAQMAR